MGSKRKTKEVVNKTKAKSKVKAKAKTNGATSRISDPSERIKQALTVLAEEIMPRQHWALWDRITANQLVKAEQAIDDLTRRVKELEKKSK
jgi:hypothetical protein